MLDEIDSCYEYNIHDAEVRHLGDLEDLRTEWKEWNDTIRILLIHVFCRDSYREEDTLI